MKNKGRLILWLVVLAAIVTIVGISVGNKYWAHKKLEGLVFFNWSHTAEKEKVLVQVGDRKFSVPINYLYNKGARKGGKVDSITLAFILPDMLPYSEETKEEFSKKGWNNKIYIDVMSRDGNPSVYESFNSFIGLGGYSVLEKTEVHDLIFYKNLKYKSRPDLFIPSREDNQKIYFYCKKYQEGKSPNCKGMIDYSKDVYVNYSFSRDYIGEWKMIDERARKILSSLEI